jgi:hypothetical protein
MQNFIPDKTLKPAVEFIRVFKYGLRVFKYGRQTGSHRISHSGLDEDTTATAISMFSGSLNLTDSMPMSIDIDRYRNYKLEAGKSEEVVSHVRD